MGKQNVDIDTLISSNTRKRPGTRCRVCAFLDQCEPDVRKKIEQVLENRDQFTRTGVAAIMNGLKLRSPNGIHLTIGTSSVDRHRNKECLDG